jgi:hypothetical protein
MTTFVVQLTIADYAKWRPGFDKGQPMRENGAVKSETVRVYRDADNPKEVIVFGESSDPVKTGVVLASQEMKAAMQQSGVICPPKVHWVS